VSERAKILLAAKDDLLNRAEAIARIVHLETGKPEVEALLGEVLPSADSVDYWTESIEEFLDVSEVELGRFPRRSGSAYREPRGIVALLTPWNYPVALPLRTLVPALLAGNAVVWKPSETSPRAAQVVFDLFDTLLPRDVLVLLQGAADVGAALASAEVDVVVFSGDVAAGRQVAHACAERVSPCVLDLRSKDAAIVLADANLERAANGVVWAALTNAGQSCSSIERVYVESPVAKRFIEKVVEKVKALRLGVDLSPLTTDGHLATVLAQVAEAKAAGARVPSGGEPKRLAPPPIVVEVENDESAPMRSETFGPVIPIAIVVDAEEAIRRVNDSRFGLTASLWTKRIQRAEKIARRIRAGVVTINNSHAFTGALPFAAWGGPRESLESLTRPRFVLIDRSRRKRELGWYPYDPMLRTVALSMALMKSGSVGILRKLGAFLRLLTWRASR
jgi:acyl-CoA reductase-like NAD-dependent aldehyde dehydrogenase